MKYRRYKTNGITFSEESLTPAMAAGKALEEIGRWKIHEGNVERAKAWALTSIAMSLAEREEE